MTTTQPCTLCHTPTPTPTLITCWCGRQACPACRTPIYSYDEPPEIQDWICNGCAEAIRAGREIEIDPEAEVTPWRFAWGPGWGR